MIDAFVIATPILMLGVIALVRFVGCESVYGVSKPQPAVDAPINLVPTARDQAVGLTWDYAKGNAIDFEVWFHDESTTIYNLFPNPEIAFLTEQGTQHGTASLSNLVNGTRYFFKVVATIADGDKSLLDQSPEVSAVPGVSSFVTLDTPGNVRNDLSGWVGMTIQLGPDDIVVTQLGRLVVANNVAAHDVKIVDPAATDPTKVVVATVTLQMPAGPAGQFAYISLPQPATLSKFRRYHVVTSEQIGGDAFLDIVGMSVTTTNVAMITSAVYSVQPSPDTFIEYGSTNQTYGPVDFRY